MFILPMRYTSTRWQRNGDDRLKANSKHCFPVKRFAIEQHPSQVSVHQETAQTNQVRSGPTATMKSCVSHPKRSLGASSLGASSLIDLRVWQERNRPPRTSMQGTDSRTLSGNKDS